MMQEILHRPLEGLPRTTPFGSGQFGAFCCDPCVHILHCLRLHGECRIRITRDHVVLANRLAPRFCGAARRATAIWGHWFSDECAD